MRKKVLLIIICILTVLFISFELIVNYSTRYNKHITKDWDEFVNLTKTRTLDENLKLEYIRFNNQSLVIDEENNFMFYIVSPDRKYNPIINYKTSKNNIRFNCDRKLTYKMVDEWVFAKCIIYNDTEYNIYKLLVTKYPIMNILYDENKYNRSDIPVTIN